MRPIKSKFSKNLPKAQFGMNFDQLGSTMQTVNQLTSNKQNNAASPTPVTPQTGLIGLGLDLLTKPDAVANPTTKYSQDAAAKYQKQLDKQAKTSGVIQGIGAAAKPLDMVIPGLGTAIGATAGLVAKAVPIFNKKPEKAFRTFEKAQQMGERVEMGQQGAINYNKMGGFKAPAYGKRGMKFQTKYSKAC